MTSKFSVGGALRGGQQRRQSRRAYDVYMFHDHMILRGKHFKVKYRSGDVYNLNKKFIGIIEEIRGDVYLDEKTSDKYLENLREIGTDAYSLLPDGFVDFVTETESELDNQGISLDFRFPPDMALLWEMVYTGDPFKPVDIEKFWGFRYPIGHIHDGSPSHQRIKLQHGMFALYHDSLVCTKQELQRIKQIVEELGDKLAIHLCFVDHKTLFRDNLDDKSLMEHFSGGLFGYGVVHFACHCDNAKEASASEAYLCVTVHQNEIRITLSCFEQLASHGYKFPNLPLVFLNACETSTPLHMLQSLNFPSSLLRFGAGGVIATNCVMPDNFASAFATKFYEELLQKPLAALPAYIGETLLETRWHLLNKYNNPLGLAYGLYAISDQQLLVLD
jgi:hypothetical protein